MIVGFYTGGVGYIYKQGRRAPDISCRFRCIFFYQFVFGSAIIDTFFFYRLWVTPCDVDYPVILDFLE